MPSPLADAFDHHVWATLRVLDVCAALGDAQLATTVPGTYGSILDTIRHLVGGDVFYLDVLTDRREPFDEPGSDIATLRAVMDAHGPVWQRLIADDDRPDHRRHRARGQRLGDARAAGHPARAGAPPWHRPSKPGLHRADDPRRGTARDRRVGFRETRRAPVLRRTGSGGQPVALTARARTAYQVQPGS